MNLKKKKKSYKQFIDCSGISNHYLNDLIDIMSTLRSRKFQIEIDNLIKIIKETSENIKKWCFDEKKLNEDFKITMFIDNVRRLDRV